MNRKLILLFLMLLWLFKGALAQSKHEYFFDGNFKEKKGGPLLTESMACGAAKGAFSVEVINTSAGPCIVDTSFCFNDGGGVAYKNQNYITSNYTINVFFKFNALVGTWSRIIDFSNSKKDEGIYWNKQCLNFYPNGNVGACPYFSANTFYLITFVREGATGIISIYVDGVLFGTYNDSSTNIYRCATGTTPIVFFRDDTVVTCETQPGCVKYISVSNIAASAAQVVDTWKNICSIIVPVELIDFKAEQGSGTVVQLSWSTASEKNAAYFSVERSRNGYDFEELGRVNAAGRSNVLRHYRYTDRLLPDAGNYYYRLQQVDNNGKATASRVLPLTLRNVIGEMLLRPQPADEQTELVFNASGKSKFKVRVHDISGREVMRLSLQEVNEGLNTVKIPIQQLDAGLYFLELASDNGFTKSIKLEKK